MVLMNERDNHGLHAPKIITVLFVWRDANARCVYLPTTLPPKPEHASSTSIDAIAVEIGTTMVPNLDQTLRNPNMVIAANIQLTPIKELNPRLKIIIDKAKFLISNINC